MNQLLIGGSVNDRGYPVHPLDGSPDLVVGTLKKPAFCKWYFIFRTRDCKQEYDLHHSSSLSPEKRTFVFFFLSFVLPSSSISERSPSVQVLGSSVYKVRCNDAPGRTSGNEIPKLTSPVCTPYQT